MRPHPRQPFALLAPACIAALVVIVLAACGSSSSSSTSGASANTSGGGATTSGGAKPAYCAARADLQNAVSGLTHLSASGGVSGLETQLMKIQTNASALVNLAKNDLPAETSAITQSVSKLQSAVKSLSSSASASNIASVASAASSVVSSVKSFMTATASKCG